MSRRETRPGYGVVLAEAPLIEVAEFGGRQQGLAVVGEELPAELRVVPGELPAPLEERGDQLRLVGVRAAAEAQLERPADAGVVAVGLPGHALGQAAGPGPHERAVHEVQRLDGD